MRTVRATIGMAAAMLLCAGTVMADDCEARASRIMASTGATLVRRSDADTILLKLHGRDLELLCNDYLSVTLLADERLPSQDFFIDVGQAASAVVEADWPALGTTAAACFQAALRDDAGLKVGEYPFGKMFCEAKKESAVITVQPRPK